MAPNNTPNNRGQLVRKGLLAGATGILVLIFALLLRFGLPVEAPPDAGQSITGAALAQDATATPAQEEEAMATPAQEEEAMATPAQEEEVAATPAQEEEAAATPAPEEEEAQAADATPTAAPEEEAQQADAVATPSSPWIPTDRADVLTPETSFPLDLNLSLEMVVEGLTDPVNVVSANDGSGRLFVVERHGVIRIVTADDELMEEPFLDIQDQVLDAFLEQGLYDIAFHPNYAENGRFFVHFAELLRNGDGMIVEYSVSPDNPDQADPESARPILQLDQPWANHNGGELAFGPDGYLYIGNGDGGWEGDPLEAGQDLTTLLGKVLRIDVDVDPEDGRPYAIPADNPFAAAQSPQLVQLFGITEQEFSQIHTEARPEIWAWGLRNPWKFSFDSQTGDLYLPDVGQNHWEEINFQPADSTGGENYGWDILMGAQCFPIDQESCATLGVLPVANYNHEEWGSCSIIGIGIYRGQEFPQLDGVYFSGDFCSGRIWGLMQQEEGQWAYGEVLDTNAFITGAGEGENGEIYVTSCACSYGSGTPQENPSGTLWRLVVDE